jgi:ELWxxDGT repeat protein
VANDGQNGFELWRSDGTNNGTTMVRDINNGSASSNPHWLLNADNVLYFSANDGNGFRLHWFDPVRTLCEHSRTHRLLCPALTSPSATRDGSPIFLS